MTAKDKLRHIHELLEADLEDHIREAIEELLKKLSHRDIQVTKLKKDLAEAKAEIVSLRKQESAVCKAITDLENALGIYNGDEDDDGQTYS
jgi:DNA repair exonuclease SbcCD ATPase subunit